MVDRQNSSIRVHTMSRSEYLNSKHIPNSSPLLVVQPDPKTFAPQEIPLPFESKPSIQRAPSIRPSFGGRGSINQSYDVLIRENQELHQRLDELAEDLYRSNEKVCNLEASNGELLESKKDLEEELNKLRLVRLKLESELEEARRNSKPNSQTSSPNRLDSLLIERNMFEAELKKTAEELDRRKQEKIRIVSEYELKMTQLQNQLNALRNETDREKLRLNTEINRLQGDNESLNNEISELTSLKHNLIQHVTKLEADLKSKSENESENQSLQKEIDNINNLLKSKANQIANVEAEILSLNENVEQENKDLKRALEQMQTEFSIAKILFGIELERVHTILAEKIRENAEMKARLDSAGANQSPSRIKSESSSLDHSMLELQKQINELERRVETLTKENLALIDETEEWRVKYNTLEKAHKIEIDAIKTTQQGSNANRELAEKFAEEAARMEGIINSLTARNAEADVRLVMLMIEIERLHAVTDSIIAETDEWQNRYRAREKEHEEELANIKAQFEDHNKRFAGQVRESNARLEIETGSLEAQIKAYRKRNEELEHLFNGMQLEIHKHKSQAFEKNAEVESWKVKYQMLEKKYYNDMRDLRQEYELQLGASNDPKKDELDTTERSLVNKLLGAQKERIKDLEEITKALQDEMNKARSDSAEKAGEAEKWKLRIQILEKKLELEGIYVTFSPQDGQPQFIYHNPEVSPSKLFSNLEKEPLNAQLKLYKEWTQDLLNLVAVLQKELQRHKKDLFDKNMENENLKNQVKLLEQKYHDEMNRTKGEFELFLKGHKDSPDLLKDFRSLYSKPTTRGFQSPSNLDSTVHTEPNFNTNVSDSGILNNSATNPDMYSSGVHENVPTEYISNPRREAYEALEKSDPSPKYQGSAPEETMQMGGRPRGQERDRRAGLGESQGNTRPPISGTGFGQTPDQMLNLNLKHSLPVLGTRGNRFDNPAVDSLKRSYVQPTSDRGVWDDRLSVSQSNSLQNLDKPGDRSTSEDARGGGAQRMVQGISISYLKKLHETEVRFVVVSVELERVNILLKQKEQELDNLKEKYHSNEKQHSQQIGELKDKFENLLKNQIEKEMTNASGNWNSERNAMDRQIAAQKDQIKDQDAKIKALHEEIGKLQQENMRIAANERNLKFELEKAKINYDSSLRQNLTNELTDQNMKFSQERIELENDLRNHKLKSEDLENKALYLMKENDRLAAVIEERDQAIDRLLNENKERAKDLQDLHNRLYEVENQKHMELTDLKKKHEEDKHTTVQKELTRQQNDHNIQLGRLQDELAFLRSKNTEQEDQIRNLSDTVERQAFNLQSKDKDIETLRKRLREAEDNFIQEKEEMRQDFDRQIKNRVDAEVKRITERLGLEKNSAEHDRIILRQRVDELEKDLKDLESKHEQVSRELDDTIREAENWKLKYEGLTTRANMDIKQLQDEYEIKIRNQLKKEIDDMKGNFERERTMLEDFIKKLKGKGADLELRQIMLMIELDRQSTLARRQTEAYEASKAKEIEQGKKYQDEIDQLKASFDNTLREKLAAEAQEAAKNAAREREALQGQIDDFKRRNAQLEAIVEEQNKEKAELSSEKNQAERATEELKFKYEDAVREHEKALEDLKSRLHDEYGNHLREVGMTHDREKDALIEEIEDLKAKIEDLEGRLAMMGIENERLRNDLQERQNQVETLEGYNEQLQKDAKAQIEALKEHYEGAQREQELRAQQTIAALQEEVREHAEEILGRDKHIEELRNELRKLDDEKGEKIQEVDELKNDIEELHKDYKNQLKAQQQQLEQEKKREMEDALKEQAQAFEEERVKEEDNFEKEKQNLTEEFGQKMKKLEQDKEQEMTEELGKLQKKFNEERELLQGQLDSLNQDREQLVQANAARDQEINTLKYDLEFLERSKNDEIKETKKALQAEMANKLAEQEAAHTQERDTLQGHVNELGQRVTEVEQQNNDLGEEINRLKQLLAEKEAAYDALSQSMANMEHEKTVEIEELHVQFEHFKKSSIGLGEYEIRFLAEKAALESEILELQEKNRRLEDDKWSLEKEVKRLKESGQGGFSLLEKNKELLTKIKELDELKKKYEEALGNMEIAPIKSVITSKTTTKETLKPGDPGFGGPKH